MVDDQSKFKYSGKIKYVFTELSDDFSATREDGIDFDTFTAIASTEGFAKQYICNRIIDICNSHGFNRLEMEYHQSTVDIEVDQCSLLRKYLLEMDLICEISKFMMSVFNMKPVAFDDCFVVKYDMKIQQYLPRHFDAGHISFMLALSDQNDYEGGGTSFDILRGCNSYNCCISNNDSDHIVSLKIGELLLFNSDLYHTGIPITRGTRYVLVGFCYVFDNGQILRKNSGNMDLSFNMI